MPRNVYAMGTDPNDDKVGTLMARTKFMWQVFATYLEPQKISVVHCLAKYDPTEG